MDLMLMLVRTAPRLHLIFILIIIHRVHSQWSSWSVTYGHSHICALKDSTVIMSCTYSYPPGHQIRKVFWTKNPVKKVEPPDLSKDPKYSQRLQYLGDKHQYCNIRLSHVTLEDSHEYYFRFTTNITGGSWLGYPGVTLNITDLELESPERVTEGDSVNLTCKSSCELTDRPTFIWSRNSQRLTSANTGNKLTLSPVRRGDAGGYRCAVDRHNLTSAEVQLNVTFRPAAGVNVIMIIAASGGSLFFIIIIVFIIKQRRNVTTEDLTVRQNDLYSGVSQRVSVHDEPLSDTDAPYDTVNPRRFRAGENKESQYATVQFHKNTPMEREENKCQHDNRRVQQLQPATRRSDVQTLEDPSVIYSSVK